MKFHHCVKLLNACIKKGILQQPPEDKDSILVYRTKGSVYPEGWYAENIMSTAAELARDEEGQKTLYDALKSKKERENTMKIKIHQINMDRDVNRVCFLNYENTLEHSGCRDIDMSLYDTVFDGEVDADTLEEVYRIFNLDFPKGYKGRSLSVSDIVEVLGEEGKVDLFFCDSFGFQRIS